MEWYCISGSWRRTNNQVKTDVEARTDKILKEGNGVILGGALGVDQIATQFILDNGDPKNQLQIFLPIELGAYCEHFFTSQEEYRITRDQAEDITRQIFRVRKVAPHTIHDQTPFTQANQDSYYTRITKQIKACEGLYAFRVNNSAGAGFAIKEAKRLEKPVLGIKEYIIRNQEPTPHHLNEQRKDQPHPIKPPHFLISQQTYLHRP